MQAVYRRKPVNYNGRSQFHVFCPEYVPSVVFGADLFPNGTKLNDVPYLPVFLNRNRYVIRKFKGIRMVQETVMRQIQHDQRFLIFMTGTDRTLLYVNSTARTFMDSAEHRPGVNGQVQFLMQFIQQRSDVCLEYPSEEYVVDCAHSACFRIFSDRLFLSGSTSVFLHVVRDLTVHEEKSRMLFCAAVTDPLTGVLNRRGGLMQLEALLEASYGEKHILAFLDVDGLKKVNDGLGHEEGDHFITAVADILRASIRNTDILCRYGGDEFLIVFRNCAPVTSKMILARAKEKAREQGESWGKPYPISFSYGFSTLLPSHKDDFLTLLRQADLEMYRMKQRQASTDY